MTKSIRHSIVTSEGIQPKATRGAHSSKKTSLNHYNHRSELKGCFFSFIHLPVTQTNKCVFYWQPNKKSTPSWIWSLKILSVSKLSEWVSAGGNENQTHTHMLESIKVGTFRWLTHCSLRAYSTELHTHAETIGEQKSSVQDKNKMCIYAFVCARLCICAQKQLRSQYR